MIDIDLNEKTTVHQLMNAAQLFMRTTNEEIQPMIIFPADEGLAIIDLSEYGKELHTDVIQNAVNHTGATRYFGIFPAFKLSSEAVEQELFERFKKLRKEKFNEKKFKDYLTYAAKRLTEPPSQSNLSTSILIACCFDKTSGTDTLMCDYKKERGKFVFSQIDDLSRNGKIYNRLNVWHQVQFSLDSEVANDK